MRERIAREARQKAEAEQIALERSRAEQDAQSVGESRRKHDERRPAGVAAGPGRGAETQQQLPPHSRVHGQTAQEPAHVSRDPVSVSAAKPTAQPQQEQQPPLPQSPTRAVSTTRLRSQQQTANPSTGLAREATAGVTAESAKPRSSFPHAFERWETLSAHWEGLTSYWLRKLEQNKDESNRDPLSQQLARQVTDLSAAGANLFHAVVELQRLRASSERKFQRWFFETRTELERAQEIKATLEKALERERRDRADAIRDAVDLERGSSKAQKQLAEMRKELAISKEEARRAWEELGRREQEERDRTLSLQSGLPTIVGGVQVVPMMQGGGFGGRPGTAREAVSHNVEYGQGYAGSHPQVPPAVTSPPTAGPSGAYYHPQEAGQKVRADRAGGSEGRSTEGEYIVDAAGGMVLDAQGQKMIYVAAPSSEPSVSDDDEADDYDSPPTTNPASGGYEHHSASAGDGKRAGTYTDPQDYSGQGYGAPGWETVPRHHHPTRLSDVLEEDERSRTSASLGHGRSN